MRVAVIGAGWAGLAAAVELSRNHIPVTLLEAAGQAGGRARRIEARGATFDNGQHLMMGAYREMLRLLQVVGVTEDRAFHRRRLRLEMCRAQGAGVRIAFPALPAPWHALVGFLGAGGLSWAERCRALMLCARLSLSGFRLARDLDVAAWLRGAGQSPLLVKALWEPLCLAALNTPLHRASAQVFMQVLREAFATRRGTSDLLFPRADLGALFPDPAVRFIRGQGGTVLFGERVLALDVQEGRLRGIITRHGAIGVDHVIVAVSPSDCLRLVEPHAALHDLARNLAALRHEPICTVYLQYPPETRLGGEMLGLLEGTGQWILDLGAAGRPGRMAVVISGPGPHMRWDNATLLARIRHELAQHFPHWPAPAHGLVIREKRATFSCRVGVQALRPAAQTPLPGLWLAGDYTDTGLPATLEGALRSGTRCAGQILARKNP